MKRFLLILSVSIVCLTSCVVSKSKYNLLVEENQQLINTVNEQKAKIDDLVSTPVSFFRFYPATIFRFQTKKIIRSQRLRLSGAPSFCRNQPVSSMYASDAASGPALP